VNEIIIMEAQLYGDRQDTHYFSSCFNRLVFDAQFEFQRLMVISVKIVEVAFEFPTSNFLFRTSDPKEHLFNLKVSN
jgi:hypothetical protein